ncbi:MAG: branched-chain amino acid ABC transporter permease [Chloroflexota bacterium]
MATDPQAGKPASAEGPGGARRLGFLSGRAGWAAAAVALLFFIALPVQLYGSQQRTLAAAFMFVALAQGWNLIGGFAGYPSFGNVVFFGLGGYTTAILMAKAGASFYVALPAAALVGLGFAALMGVPVLRLRGHYFAIATLGVAEGMREVVLNLDGLTGGGSGLTVPAVGIEATTSYPGNAGFYYMFLALAVLATAVVLWVSRSRFGYGLRAINQDEDAAAAMGIDTTRAKIGAFALAGVITSLAGAMYAFQQVTIYPARLFDVQITLLMVVMAVIGGSGTVVGPVLGALGLQFLSEYLRDNLTDYHTFVFGVIIVVAVILLPQGLVRFVREGWRTRRFSLLDNVRAYRL